MGKAWVALDVAVVMVFVAIGRSVHEHGLTVAGMASTSWPFLAGLAIGWLVVVARGRDLTSWLGGLVVALATVAIGMVLRVIAGQGTAFAFVVVAVCFLGAGMLGWRGIGAAIRRLRPVRLTTG